MPSIASKPISETPDFIIPHREAQSADDITRASASSFLTAFRFLSKAQSHQLSVVYAYFRIIDDCVDELEWPEQKQQAIAFWETELNKAFANQDSHPIITELKKVCDQTNIQKQWLIDMITGCKQDITRSQVQSLKELQDYCYHVAVVVGLTCLQIFQYQGQHAKDIAWHFGQAFQLTNIIRDVKVDHIIGRTYLPQDLLNKHHVTESMLNEHETSAELKAALQELSAMAHSHYAQAWQLIKTTPQKSLKAVEVMATVYENLLNKIEKLDFPVLKDKIRLTRLKKAWLILPYLLNIK